MKFYRKVFISIIFICFIFLLALLPHSHAMEQSLNSLNFDISICNNGDVDIVEVWNVDMYDTNTLFKTFPNDEKYDEISNVSVVELDTTNSIISEFIKSDQYSYHVPKGYYQALLNTDNEFEIAWGVDASGSENKIYKISYTVKNCINVYNDVSEFYWQLLGKDWSMETENISGKLTLPKEVASKGDFRVWAHGPLDGEILKDNNKSCSFFVTKMPKQTFLELRIVFPNTITPYSTRTYNKNYLQNILKEEQTLADEANSLRISAQKKQKFYNITIYFVEALVSLGILKIVAPSKNDFKKITYNTYNKLDYYRDIPDENMSPVSAHMLRYFKNSFKICSMSNCISALMLSLTQKNWISIITGKTKDETKIQLNGNDTFLTEDEKRLYNYLGRIGNEFTLKEYNKYIDSHQESFYNTLKAIKSFNEVPLSSSKYLNKQNVNTKNSLKLVTACCFFITVFIIFIQFAINDSNGYSKWTYCLIISITLLFIGVLAYLKSIKIPSLTQEGLEEKEKWIGLEKFMKDFSLLKDRTIPELVLWEKYLVYATAFGIADKVLKQLKTRFPELNNDDYIRNNYSCIYMSTHSNLYGKSFNKSVSSAESYHNRQVAMSSMSSGSGGGGGFSSGGGGRRPAVVAGGGR